MVTSHAVTVPNRRQQTATPASNSAVSCSVTGSTVRIRCGQALAPGCTASTTIVATGSSITAASPAANSVQPDAAVRAGRHFAGRRMVLSHVGCARNAVVRGLLIIAGNI